MAEQAEAHHRPKIVSETAKYRDGIFTIETNPSRLSHDFLAEARKRENSDLELAEEVAEKLQLFFDRDQFSQHIVEDIAKNKIKNRWRALGKIGEKIYTATEVVSGRDTVGATYRSKTAPAIYIAVDKLPSYLKFPKDSHSEVHEAAIIQSTTGIWRHEREHLLRLIDPKAAKEDRNNRIKGVITAGASAGLISHGIISFLPDIDKLPPTNQAVVLTSTAIMSLQGSQTITQELWYNLLNKAEDAARIQAKEGSSTAGLFDITFEKK